MSDMPTPPRPARLSRPAIAALAALGALFLIAGVWLVSTQLPGWVERRAGRDAAPAGTKTEGGAAGDARKIQALLFYVTEDGAELQAATQDVLYGATPAEQARRIVDAQVQPPPAGRLSAIPAGTQVRSVYVGSKGDAYVDFSPEIRTAHSGGSLNEALAVFTIVNALTSNLPGITSVQILVDGKEVDSLAGHIDLRHPLSRADGWVRKGQ
jgi:spore germination protein GerM